MKKIKIIIDVFKMKIIALLGHRIAFSALCFNSKVDKHSIIRQNVRFYDSEIKNYSYIGRNSLIQNTTIGKFCSISEGCNIGMPSHPISHISTSPVFLAGSNCFKTNWNNISYEDCERTIINNDVWIGTNVMIKSGITIGNGAIIGAGSIVTHDVESYAIVAGVPAKVIKYRFSKDDIEFISKTKWWDCDEKYLEKYGFAFENIDKFKMIGENANNEDITRR